MTRNTRPSINSKRSQKINLLNVSKKLTIKMMKMIFLLFHFCRPQTKHFFAFNESITRTHYVEQSLSNLTKHIQENDFVYFLDEKIANQNVEKMFNFIQKVSNMSITLFGNPSVISLKSLENISLRLEDSNLSFSNFTFNDCHDNLFDFSSSTIEFNDVIFFGHSTVDPLLKIENCTFSLNSVTYKNGKGPILIAESSIIFTKSIFFYNIECKDQPFIALSGSSFESNLSKMNESNLYDFILMNNSNFFLSNFNCRKSAFSNSLISSVYSNTFIKQTIFKNCKGTLSKVTNDSQIHISSAKIVDHFSEDSFFVSVESSVSVFDSLVADSNIKSSFTTVTSSPSFIFSNFSLIRSIFEGTIFELEETNAEISLFTASSLISECGACILHAENCDYIKASSLRISGLISRKNHAAALVFSDVSSAYFDDLHYFKNAVPLAIINSSDVVFAYSNIKENDISALKTSLNNIPSVSLLSIFSESSAHFIGTSFTNNQVENGCMLLSLHSVAYFMHSNFTRNTSPFTFIKSESKFSRSFFSVTKNYPVIEAISSRVNIHRCLFSEKSSIINDKTFEMNHNKTLFNSIVVARNDSSLLVNTTIVNATDFIVTDSSQKSHITLDSCRFDSDFDNSLNTQNNIKVILIDTLFNCNFKCEARDNEIVSNLYSNEASTINDFAEKKPQKRIQITKKEKSNNVESNKEELNKEESNKEESNKEELNKKDLNVNKNSQTQMYQTKIDSRPKILPLTAPIESAKSKFSKEDVSSSNKLLFNQENNRSQSSSLTKNEENNEKNEIINQHNILNMPINGTGNLWKISFTFIPLTILIGIILYRFRSPRFVRASRRLFSAKGRYQL
ncbi:hypothetical protein TRFO_28837 [Tritrichomonas foetus]|uniref:Right handed beta helix domain-containing protein n=1 Tax=Tritrichomonas foetus TaxID=1144522 RepID=A0A1J4K1T2_9EUKA|nr:hypothetical protein TRFO_28837 [Tritrichomonas foetus]|eukprot:OHT03702.1 hypothetical protein TRFO_28837 [Tritrichomonas foetus]